MIFEKIRAILAEQLDVEEKTITLDSHIQNDLGADSMDVLDLVMSFEEEFDCEIPDDAVENLRTVGDVVHYIEEMQN